MASPYNIADIASLVRLQAVRSVPMCAAGFKTTPAHHATKFLGLQSSAAAKNALQNPTKRAGRHGLAVVALLPERTTLRLHRWYPGLLANPNLEHGSDLPLCSFTFWLHTHLPCLFLFFSTRWKACRSPVSTLPTFSANLQPSIWCRIRGQKGAHAQQGEPSHEWSLTRSRPIFLGNQTRLRDVLGEPFLDRDLEPLTSEGKKRTHSPFPPLNPFFLSRSHSIIHSPLPTNQDSGIYQSLISYQSSEYLPLHDWTRHHASRASMPSSP